MGFKRFTFIPLVTLSCLLQAGSLFAIKPVCIHSRYSPIQAARLNWVVQKNPYNICGGYYRESSIPYKPSPYAKAQQGNFDITADSVEFSLKGTSTLKGHVVLMQPGRELTANEAHLYSDKVTGKKTSADLIGDVRLMEQGRLIVGDRAKINLVTKEITVDNVSYRAALNNNKTFKVKNSKTGKEEIRLYQMTGQGTARQAKQIKPRVFELNQAVFSTCAPTRCTWNMHASKIRLDFNSGRGYATNSRFTLGGLPIFYSPYFNFPINKKRYTGFLVPEFGHEYRDGLVARFPFYFNLAPNADLTVTPSVLTHRGLFVDGKFRYLTKTSKGDIKFGYIGSDRQFKNFQKKAPMKFPGQPTLDELESDSANRGGVHWNNATQFNPHWASDIHFNYISDDYFLQDFGSGMFDVSDNQLLRQANIKYIGKHWDFLGNLQDYQTLHPVNQSTILNQYGRLPQFRLNADYPDSLFGFHYGLKSEIVHFWKERNPGETVSPVNGNRIAVRPVLSTPLVRPYGYFTPRIQLQALQYKSLKNVPTDQPTNTGMVLPIVDLKTGLYFDRYFSWFHKPYQQTLEPVVYYLYVPYRNQNNFPIFNTTLPTFTYDQMFEYNRFSGVDRIGDANQLTWGLVTRFIDADTGDERANFKIGRSHYFSDRRVTLCYGDAATCSVLPKENTRTTSPLVAAATYHFNKSWSGNADITWNSSVDRFDNGDISLQYKPDIHHIINLAYHYKREGDVVWYIPTGDEQNDLKQTDISVFWQLNHHWSVMGRWNYNWSHGHDQSYLYGLAYESCGWAVRFINARTFVGPYPEPSKRNKYDRTFYIQFALKGLGNVSVRNPIKKISSSISGYEDTFGLEN